MLKINNKKMLENGFKFDNMDDLYLYMCSIIEWLECHNKNYTKEQYYRISILKDVIDFIDIE